MHPVGLIRIHEMGMKRKRKGGRPRKLWQEQIGDSESAMESDGKMRNLARYKKRWTNEDLDS